jgi:hypothetical protein
MTVTVGPLDLPFELAVKMSGIEQLRKAISNGELFQFLQHLNPFEVQAALIEHPFETQQKFFQTNRLENEVAGTFFDGLFV